MFNWFSAQSQSVQIITGLVLVAFISVLDFVTGTELSFSIFYFLPIIVISWYVNFRTGVYFSFLSAGAWAFADIMGGNVYSALYVFGFNTFVRLGIFLVITSLIWKLKEGSILVTKNELLAQRSYDVITTSQKLITVIAKNIIDHNSKLMLWLVKQKQQQMPVPDIVETTCQQIGTNLASLTEVCYSFRPLEQENIDLEDFISKVEEHLNLDNTNSITRIDKGILEEEDMTLLDKNAEEATLLIKLVNEKLAQ